jgi:hypothetical protein
VLLPTSLVSRVSKSMDRRIYIRTDMDMLRALLFELFKDEFSV